MSKDFYRGAQVIYASAAVRAECKNDPERMLRHPRADLGFVYRADPSDPEWVFAHFWQRDGRRFTDSLRTRGGGERVRCTDLVRCNTKPQSIVASNGLLVADEAHK